MSWYGLKCEPGQEQTILCSCRQYLPDNLLEDAFVFQCERLWKSEGVWKNISKIMFPGYIFLQSNCPVELSRELHRYGDMAKSIEEKGCLIAVHEEEEKTLRKICGEKHFLHISYGYKDREEGVSYITKGPLACLQDKIVKLDWHRRYALLELKFSKRRAVIWAGIDIAPEIIHSCRGTV